MTLVLTSRDLRPLIHDREEMDRAIQLMEDAALAHDRGEHGACAWVDLPLAGDAGRVAVYSTTPVNGGTTVRIFPGINSPGADSDGYVMLLIDPDSGRVLSMLGGEELNTLRTSLPAAIGVRHLSSPDARTLGVLGSGAQARSHIRLFVRARPELDHVRVWSRTPANRERFAEEMTDELGLPVEVTADADELLSGVDVLTIAAPGSQALEGATLRPGALVVSMTHAVPPSVLATMRQFVPVHKRPDVLAMSRGGTRGNSGGANRGPSGPPNAAAGPPGAVTAQAPPEGTKPEIHQLVDVINGKTPAREEPSQTVAYELGAMYGWDAPTMRWAYDWAVANQVGTDLKLTD